MVFKRISTLSAPNLELKFRIKHIFYCYTIEYRLFQIIFKLGFTVCNDVPPGVTKALQAYLINNLKNRTWSVWWRDGFIRVFTVAFNRLFRLG